MPLQHNGFYLLRTPLLSPEDLAGFNREADENPGNFIQNILQQFDNDLLQEALYIASPALYHEYQRLKPMPAGNEKALKKIALTLYKYFIRMCTRATPYGLFAGYGMGHTAETTDIRFSNDFLLRQSRLDCFCISEIVLQLLQDTAARAAVLFYPNNTIYKTSQGYRYIEYSTENNQYNYFLSGFPASEEIELVLAAAAAGAAESTLASLLISDDISAADAACFIRELVDNKILISELEPRVTGDNHLSRITEFLQRHQVQPQTHKLLTQVNTLLQQHITVKELESVVQLIKQLLPHSSNTNIIQTDARVNATSNTIAENIIATITNQLEEIAVINHQLKSPDLETFKNSFTERYGDREMPLAEALDPDIGIGYGLYVKENTVAPGILKDLPLAINYNEPPRGGEIFLKWLQSLLINALTDKQYEIDLQPHHLQAFDSKGTKLPPSLYAIGALHRADDAQGFLFDMHSISGPSAGNLMARFCCNYPELTAAITGLLQKEADLYPGAILAEITHLAQARMGNILLRPALRQYELPLVTPGAAAAKDQLPLGELAVSISNNTIVLRNTRINKEVLPRLSSAHNFSRNNIAVYKFLADLQYQPFSFLSKWTWGGFKNEIFLPRVRYKNIILSKASWHITAAVFERYGLSYSTAAAFSEGFGFLCRQLSIPAEVELADGDNTLLLDTGSATSLLVLHKTFSQEKVLSLQESFAGSKHSFFFHNGKGKANELIIPLNTVPETAYKPPDFPGDAETVQRSFMPGSDWLYVKLYCGYSSADMLITDLIQPLAGKLQKAGIIKKWFFIRYNDPGHHLRIRFYNSDAGFWKEAMEQLTAAAAPWIAEGRITKVQLDSYDRELERYGAAKFDFAESFFHLDSQVSTLLLKINEIAGLKWLAAMLNCDALLSDFECSLPMKYSITKGLAAAYFEETGGGDLLAVKLNGKFRQARTLIEDAFANEDTASSMSAVKGLLRQRSAQMKKLMEMHAIQKGDDHFTYRSGTSFMHMSLNRLFTASPRRHEMLVYHHLSRYYESAIARLKKTK
jgi:lantibiotic biosynthesis protein